MIMIMFPQSMISAPDNHFIITVQSEIFFSDSDNIWVYVCGGKDRLLQKPSHGSMLPQVGLSDGGALIHMNFGGRSFASHGQSNKL